MVVPISELNYSTGQLKFASPDGRYGFEYEDGTLVIVEVAAQPVLQADAAAPRGLI